MTIEDGAWSEPQSGAYHLGMQPCVYILTSRRRGPLYVGVTSDIAARLVQHRAGAASEFTSKYNVKKLVHCEFLDTMADAIHREKQLKNWHRTWKIELIEASNPDWSDLFDTLNA